MIGAEKYGQEEEEIKVELTPEEEKMAQSIKVPRSHEHYDTFAQKYHVFSHPSDILVQPII